jgi:magnesium-protoporphyrin O-methyltransferase
MTAYDRTLSRVETYFDQTATKTWERLTSDAPVSRVRETVRAGRNQMRQTMLNTLGDVRGKRILDAGCGAGQMTHELALRGAEVVAVDISPSLVEIAGKRLPDSLYHQVTYHVGDMLDPALGEFDHVVAMDSLIYYDAADINRSISTLLLRTGGKIVFTVAPRTPFLMAFFGMGKLFPRRDRSPIMIPHAPKKLARLVDANLRSVARISSGFYISECLEVTK